MLETVEAALTGPIGIAVATLAVIGTGFMCMMGRLNWGSLHKSNIIVRFVRTNREPTRHREDRISEVA